jgi:ABC-type nickel/cobalt efflux system permease component RcnA
MSDIFLFFSATSAAAILGFGFLLGLKHATEADHLAAVSTMVTERRSLWSSALVGMWGLGDTISLTLAGIFVLVLNFEISERAETALEFCVGIMLTLLGLNVLKKLVRGGYLHFHPHEHGSHAHVHPHVHEPGHAHEPHTLGLLYIVVFWIGSIGGMMIMSFLVELPFTLTALKFNRFNHVLQGAAGLMSIGLGLLIVYEKGFS